VTRKVCVVTGSRADFGLLRFVMEAIQQTHGLALQVVATGMHLSSEFGLTYREIEEAGFRIDCRVEMLLSGDTPTAVAKSIGLGVIGFGDALAQLAPDVLVVLGDRFEVFAAATAAMVARIPIAHLHGGETTEGAFDEAIRHAITKMAHLHFVAAEDYRRRVIQLGEHPDRVFVVGGLGVDSLRRLSLLEREALEDALGFKLGPRSLLVTYHPVTLEPHTSAAQMAELLAALDAQRDTHLIFTTSNADNEGRVLSDMVRRFVADRPHARAFTSLGQVRYLSCVRQVDAVVGNSSSGLTEVPSFRKPTVNIGQRQAGRLRAASVIDCPPERAAISAAIEQATSPAFQASLRAMRNPYGEGGASEAIAAALREARLDTVLKKSFWDLRFTRDALSETRG
jgi:GDP/UDP-N,N'-diacetylbacillosamine 2-epimerase (hydrolysing)